MNFRLLHLKPCSRNTKYPPYYCLTLTPFYIQQHKNDLHLKNTCFVNVPNEVIPKSFKPLHVPIDTQIIIQH